MAEEDLMFGKMRHLFGGIQPSNMKTFTAQSSYENGILKIRITASLPDDTVIDGQTLCSVEGAVIRRSTTDYPKNEFEGELFADITDSCILEDTNVESGVTYYYSAFPYTDQGCYNRNKSNRTNTSPVAYTYLFGYDLDLNDTNPETRVSYPSNVDNANYAPAGNTAYDNSKPKWPGTFSYGDWPNIPGKFFMPRPCMLNADGTVYEYLNPNDYSLNVNGQPSQISNSSFNGNAMMEWPKIYTHREEVDGVYKFRCSDGKLGDDWDCWCNYDKDNNVIEKFYTSIYAGDVINGKLRSLSGITPNGNITIEAEIEAAKANGEDWYIDCLADRLLIQDLLVMISKSTNSQKKYGYGNTEYSNYASKISNGILDSNGLFFGYNLCTSVKTFGMENLWGNLYRRIAGWILDDGVQKIKLTRGNHDGTTVDDYNVTGEGYIALGDSTPDITTGSYQYISKMKTTPYGRIPIVAKGSNSTYECDAMRVSDYDLNGINLKTNKKIPIVGGCAILPNAASSSIGGAEILGVFYVHISEALDSASRYIASGLSCKPSAL